MPEITEASVMEALGLADSSQGGQEQGLAAPAAGGEQAAPEGGEQEQGLAAPAQGDAETGSEGTPEGNEGDSTPQPGKQTLTAEERRANAARRRAQEQQAAVDRAVAAEREKNDAAMSQFFKDANLKNTFTGKPITNMDEFREWKEAFDTARTEKAMKAGKLTPQVLNDAISKHPTVQKAEAVIAQAEQQQKQQREAADKARIDAELQEISRLDPGIKGMGDLLKMPTAEAFRENIRKGYSLLDSYRLANFDQLTASRAAAARQQALNNTRGKDHLSATGNSRGAGAESVPADQMRYFRMMMPEATDEQIRAYYNKHKPK